MKRKLLLALVVELFASLGAAEDIRPFPLLGIWRAISATAPDGTPFPMKGEAEMEFLPNGILLISVSDPQISDGIYYLSVPLYMLASTILRHEQ